MGLNETLREREKTHGDFRRTAEIATALIDMTRPKGGVPENAVQRYAREMICGKLARIASGDPTFVDHWQDIAGYAQLVVQAAEVEPAQPSFAFGASLGPEAKGGPRPNLVDPPRPFPPRPYAAPAPEFRHTPRQDLNP